MSDEASGYNDAVSLRPGKTVQDITLPNVRTMHVFAIAAG